MTTALSRLIASLAATAALGVSLVATAPAGSAETLPYTDPNVVGNITLCNQAGHVVTSGTIFDEPFVWRAVADTAAPAAADGHVTAALYAYQPRANVPPKEWSGTQMTSSTTFSNPAHPIAQATRADFPLYGHLYHYEAVDDGLVELRIYLDSSKTYITNRTYDAIDLQVRGDVWQVVRGGGHQSCAGAATSLETAVLPAARLTPIPLPPPGGPLTTVAGPTFPVIWGKSWQAQPVASRADSVASAAATATPEPLPTSAGAGAAAARLADHGSSGSAPWTVLAGVLALLLAAGALTWWRLAPARATRSGRRSERPMNDRLSV